MVFGPNLGPNLVQTLNLKPPSTTVEPEMITKIAKSRPARESQPASLLAWSPAGPAGQPPNRGEKGARLGQERGGFLIRKSDESNEKKKTGSGSTNIYLCELFWLTLTQILSNRIRFTFDFVFRRVAFENTEMKCDEG